MVISESIRTSLEEVRAHKLRSALTLSGVVLGTIALVIVLSVLEGVRAAVWQGFDDLGMDGVIFVSRQTPSDRVERAKSHLSRGLRHEDVRYLGTSDTIQAIAPVGETRAIVTAGTARRRVVIYGVTPEFAQVKNRKTSEGRFISARDQQSVAAVCVLGFKLKEKLFGGEEAIGQKINVAGRRLVVVGVGTKFNMEFVNDDDMEKETSGVYMPLSTYETIFGKANAISYVMLKAITPELSLEAEEETSRLYARAHAGIHDVKIDNVGKEILKERGNVVVILRNWKIVFFAIAGVSLLIGGVGIFSVLKIAISERLYEIGLRKSMGATDSEIFFQFLIESITLSTVGSFLGGALGCIFVKVIASFFPAGLPISMSGLVTACSFAVMIGLFAGLYPSITASRLTPVEALRA
ncbi:MAG TPA: ABC transporter permease [Thermoanaerobaculia bacterium]|nr:ABC transporter permease [Thermoanaerobaculia bacterium]